MSQDPAPGPSPAVATATPPTVTPATTTPATATSTTASTSSDPFVRNLVFLVVISVAVSAWLLAYTDWFGEISALFALGGLFTWVGVISKLLNDARTDQLQAWVESAVFANRTLARRLAALAIALIALASFIGTIEVRSQGDSSDRLLWFDFDAPTNRLAADRLEPAGQVRAPWATSWWPPARVRVKVSGYPSLVATVRPWQRVQLVSPSSFLMTPVILLVPSSQLAQFTKDTKLVVTVDGAKVADMPFDGHSLWIGCEDDVTVPDAIVNEWRTSRADATIVAAWQSPHAVRVDLRGGSSVTVVINHEDGTAFIPPLVIKVRAPARPEDFPQREIIDVPTP